MALTMPALWEESRLNTRARRVVVVQFEDESGIWLVGTQAMNLTDGYVHQGLISISDIESGFDLYTKRWIVPSVLITISNKPYTRTDASASDKRLSDMLIRTRTGPVSIYYLKGDRVTSLAHGLKRFVGEVLRESTFDDEKIVITAGGSANFSDLELPRYTVGESLPVDAIPTESLGSKIPLAWGRFIGESDTEAPTGLMASVRITNVDEPKFLCADHICSSISKAYLKIEGLPDLSQFIDKTSNVDESGRATVTPTITATFPEGPWSYYLTGKFRPRDTFRGSYVITPDPDQVNSLRLAFDKNPETCAEVMDELDNGTYMSGRAYFTWDDFTPADDVTINSYDPGLKLEVLAASVAGGTYFAGTYGQQSLWLYYGLSGGSDLTLKIVDLTLLTTKSLHSIWLTGDPPDYPNRWPDWKLRTRNSPNAVPAYNELLLFPLMINLYLRTDNDVTDPAPNYFQLEQWLARIYDIRIVINHLIPFIYERAVWVEGEGRAYGSWITGRSSNYAVTDTIEDPAGIIESVFRDVLGLPTANIDMPSFIAAENTGVTMRVNLHEGFKAKALDLVRMIAEQSTLAFSWSAEDKARVINLTDKTPTTNHIIPFSHVRPGGFSISKASTIRNYLLLKSRWRNEFGAFADDNSENPVEDATSQTALGGIFKYTGSWRFLATAAKDAVAALYCNATDGLWSKDHNVLTLETMGDLWAHVQEGDWCEMESLTWDPQLTLRGATWSGAQFIVTKVAQSMTGTKMTLIQLW